MARWFLLIAVLLITVARAGAQPLPDHHDLAGHLDQWDGKPAAGYTLELYRTNSRDMVQTWSRFIVTDARGDFSVPAMEDGAYLVRVTCDDYEAILPDKFTIVSATAWKIALPKRAWIRAHLLLPNGKPVDVHRRFYNFQPGDGESRLPVGAEVTDSEGILHLRNIPPGIYRDLKVQDPEDGFAAFPGPIDLLHKEGCDLTLKLMPGGTLIVRVLETTAGAPPPVETAENTRPHSGTAVLLMKVNDDKDRIDELGHAMFMRRIPREDRRKSEQVYTNLIPANYTLSLRGVKKERFVGPVEQTVQVKSGVTTTVTFYLAAKS